LAGLLLEKMLEAGPAETQSRGEMFHQLWLLEFARHGLQHAEDSGVRDGMTAPGMHTQRLRGKFEDNCIAACRRGRWANGRHGHDGTSSNENEEDEANDIGRGSLHTAMSPEPKLLII